MNINSKLDLYKTTIMTLLMSYQRKISNLENKLNSSSRIYQELLERKKNEIKIHLQKYKFKLEYLENELEKKLEIPYPHIKIDNNICLSKTKFMEHWNKNKLISIVFNDGEVNLNKLFNQ